jgi:hypothetical protein
MVETLKNFKNLKSDWKFSKRSILSNFKYVGNKIKILGILKKDLRISKNSKVFPKSYL